MRFRLLAASLLTFAALAARAQNVTTCTTNFYPVTGSTIRELRESIVQSRPRKNQFDGETHWDVTWKYQYAPRAGGCAVTSYAVTTKIIITLPRWTPPAGVDSAVKEHWTRYYTNLAQHEWGHARIATAAGEEVAKKIGAVSAQSECEALKKLVDEQAGRALADCHARETEYDRRTDHGLTPAGHP